MATTDPVLTKLCAALNTLYGQRLERIVLFGSRARGESRQDSDYDIAIFLKNFSSRWHEIDQIVEIETDILYETGAVIHAQPFAADAYRERTPLMHEIRQEGLDL